MTCPVLHTVVGNPAAMAGRLLADLSKKDKH